MDPITFQKLRDIETRQDEIANRMSDPDIARDPTDARRRMRATLELLETLTAWSDEMLRLDTATLTQVLKLGARIKKLLGRRSDAGKSRKDVPWNAPSTR